MRSSREFARKMRDSLRSRDLSPVIEELVRCASVVHADDEFIAPLARKLLHRHARRAGRKKHSGPTPYRQKIAKAALWARYNAKGLGGKKRAAKQAADAEGVPFQSVYRAAFTPKDSIMSALMREISGARE